jgi:hypothetical protein
MNTAYEWIGPADFKLQFNNSLTRWKAFWRHTVADRPPLVLRFKEESDDRDPVLLDLRDFTRQFDIEYVIEKAQRSEKQFARRADFPDDTFPQVVAPNGLAVTGWALGAQVAFAAEIPWVCPVLDSVEDWRKIDFIAVNRRFDQIRDIDEVLVSRSRGRYAVSSASLDGPADMAVRLLGEEKLALALYDQAEEVNALFNRCLKLWQQVVHRKLQVIPQYGGGTTTGWNYWVPGQGIAFQEDFGQMVSPNQFREMILKYDVRLLNDLDCVWYHVHSGAMHMAREIADSGAFDGIQITNDYPAGPGILDILPSLKYIQKRTCLILRKFSLDQLDSVIGFLSPEGLAIDVQCYDSNATDDIQTTLMSKKEAQQVIQWAEDWMQKI